MRAMSALLGTSRKPGITGVDIALAALDGMAGGAIAGTRQNLALGHHLARERARCGPDRQARWRVARPGRRLRARPRDRCGQGRTTVALTTSGSTCSECAHSAVDRLLHWSHRAGGRRITGF